MNSIAVKNLHKTYSNGTKALKGVSFEIKNGEKVSILGHNGSGKSTLFKVLTGFEKPTEGEVIINGVDMGTCSKKKLKEVRKEIGMVFQHFNLIDNLTVFQNVLFGSLGRKKFLRTLSPLADDSLREEAMECLERVGLPHLAEKRADEISGGQKQRVAIARMIMQKPKLILADEPIAALDPKASRDVMDLLVEVAREEEIPLVCVLHQIPEAMEYSERIIGLKEGEKEIDGTPAESEEMLKALYQHGNHEDEVSMKELKGDKISFEGCVA